MNSGMPSSSVPRHQRFRAMGQYQFVIPESDRFARDSIANSQIVGLEGIPWPGKNLISADNLLTIHRNQEISGRLLVPFLTRKFGNIALTTGTLPERTEPYFLDLELARGTLSRLRNQISNWEEGGLRIGDDFNQRVDAIVQLFAKSLFAENDSAAERTALCEQVIDEAVELMLRLTQDFSSQVAKIHQAQKQSVAIIAGSVLDSPHEFDSNNPLHAMAIQRMSQPKPLFCNEETDLDDYDFSCTDQVVDWVNEPDKKTIRVVGPILQFDNIDLPAWLPEKSTFEERLDHTKRFCRNFGVNYHKRIKVLHVASGLSGVGHQHWNYPQQLQLTLEMLETLDQTMPNTSMMVSFDQPWGERLAMATGGIPAMEIADSLLRYGTRISAFGLEFNLDYTPQGTLMRDPFQWVDLIDRWSQFGLPLAIYLSAPLGDVDSAATSRFTQTISRSANAEAQAEYLQTVFNLLVRRPAVNVVAWRRTYDTDNQRFPLSGLSDGQSIKPAVGQLNSWIDEVRNG